MKAVLLLEDGTYFPGKAFGKEGEVVGEVIFNTSMTGYQEIITDPSYTGQIVAMTYPLIGNYGFNEFDNESDKAKVAGFVVKELCDAPSNWRNSIKPEEYFINNDVVGIQGLDTRALAQHIRESGSMMGIISTECGNAGTLLERLKQKKIDIRCPVMEATAKNPVHIEGCGKRVVIIDFGVKHSFITALKKRNCDIYIIPAGCSFKEVMSFEAQGILLSNGPGNPENLPEIIKTIQQMIGKIPILGIGLGHQLLGLALGGKTCKLKFGHHGSNHPVKDCSNGKCLITSQSHSYVIEGFIPDATITHININDGSVEGFRHNSLPIMGIQYHPRELPEMQDLPCIFDEFLGMLV